MKEIRFDLSSTAILTFSPIEEVEGFGCIISSCGQAAACNNFPIAVQIFNAPGFTWHRCSYKDVRADTKGASAFGEIRIAESLLFFEDSYAIVDNGFIVSRIVDVKGSSPKPGFLTSMEWQLVGATMDDLWFAPGVWYGRNAYAPPYAIGSPVQRVHRDYLVFREDRLPLPFIMHYDEKKQLAFCMTHLDGKPETVEADDNDAPVIDNRIAFGAFGIYTAGCTVAFWYPGTEGEVLYPPMWCLGRGNDQADSVVNPFKKKSMNPRLLGWNYRYHPLEDGFVQDYTIRIDMNFIDTYWDACTDSWRKAYVEYQPKIYSINLDEIERVSLELLQKLVTRSRSAIGIPTWIDCFTGKPGKVQNTFGIGFVSRNLEVAYVLLQAGYEQGKVEYQRIGRDITDFWVSQSGKGLSHTEYDPSSGQWIDSMDDSHKKQVFLRDQSESYRICLKSWLLERDSGNQHPEWIEWVTSFSEWLRKNQNPDGSYFRSYLLQGEVVSKSKADCSHVIPFLVELASIIDNKEYMKIALAVADYLWNEYHQYGEFIGGTLDNPTCYDKEASALAMEAYLCLYKATKKSKWLEAAEFAARTCETWIFCWEIPMPLDDRENRFFSNKSSNVGYQLITTGFSAFDTYLTRHVGDFARLSRYTGDMHYIEVARLLLYNTKHMVQKKEEYGYAYPGMQIEHWSMGRGRGFGLNSGLLPWVPTSHVVGIKYGRKYVL